jgi:hypothetical protein
MTITCCCTNALGTTSGRCPAGENFFTRDDTLNHKLGMHYLVSFAPHAAIYDITRDHIGIEDGNPGGLPLQLIFRWFPPDTLAGERIYPTFLRQRLSALPSPSSISSTSIRANHTQPSIAMWAGAASPSAQANAMAGRLWARVEPPAHPTRTWIVPMDCPHGLPPCEPRRHVI